MNPADPFGLIGQVLDGQFRVDRFVGEGGFSFVYRGHHAGLNEPIAIKCLKLPPAIGSALVESFIRRFRDESRIHYRLSQGNLAIARSIASGTTMSSRTSALVPYMVLEWLEGRSLAQDFDVRRERGMTGRSMDEVIRLLDSAAQGLAFAHAQGVVHRDMNPGNLFLAERQQSPDGTMTKVLDFGVAKVISDHALELGPRAATLGQIRIFAPAYGSPEQFDDAVGKVGPQSDVYSFSLISLEALRDLPVRDGEHIGEFALMALDPNVRPTPRSLGVPVGDAVEDIFKRAGALRPADRPSDMGEFWGGLKHAIRTDASSGKAPYADSVPSRPWKPRPPAAGHAPDRPVTADMPAAPVVEVLRPGSLGPPAPDPARSNLLNATMQLQRPAAPVPGPVSGSRSGSGSGSATPLTSTLVMDSRIHNTPVPAAPPAPPKGNLNATVALHSFGYSQNVPPVPAPAPPPPLATMVMDGSNAQMAAQVAAARAMAEAAAAAGGGFAKHPMAATQAPFGQIPTYPSAPAPPPPLGRADVTTSPPAASSGSAGKMIAIATVAILVVLGGGAFAYLHFAGAAASEAAAAASASAAAAAASASAAAAAAAASASAAAASASAAATVPRAVETAPAPAETATAAPAPQAAAEQPPPSSREAAFTEPAPHRTPSTSAATTAPAVAPAAHSAAPTAASTASNGGFDPAVARAGLDVMNGVLASCRNPGGKTGEGKITVTFAPDGKVDRASVDQPPFAGTPEGTCATALFKRTKIAPFTGEPGTVGYTFRVPK